MGFSAPEGRPSSAGTMLCSFNEPDGHTFAVFHEFYFIAEGLHERDSEASRAGQRFGIELAGVEATSGIGDFGDNDSSLGRDTYGDLIGIRIRRTMTDCVSAGFGHREFGVVDFYAVHPSAVGQAADNAPQPRKVIGIAHQADFGYSASAVCHFFSPYSQVAKPGRLLARIIYHSSPSMSMLESCN